VEEAVINSDSRQNGSRYGQALQVMSIRINMTLANKGSPFFSVSNKALLTDAASRATKQGKLYTWIQTPVLSDTQTVYPA